MNLDERFVSWLEAGVTLPGALVEAAEASPTAGITYVAGDGSETRETYRDLVARARRVAGGLRRAGAAEGDSVVLQLDGAYEFLAAFWGALFAGCVPVPLSVASSAAESDTDFAKLRAVHAALGAPLVVGASDGDVARAVGGKRFVAITELAACDASAGDPGGGAAASEVAFLMFSSGSTGAPKGVRLTHANVLHNARQIVQRSAIGTGDTALSWLPLSHDMGLVLFHLVPALASIAQVKMAPLTFVRRPELFLRKIAEHRATIAGAPNFAIDHITRTVTSEALAGLDLSTLRMLCNGAEPISPDVCRAFVARLAPAGLAHEVIHPGYGIAEACVTAAQHPAGARAGLGVCPLLRVDREILVRDGRAVPVGEGASDAIEIASLGAPMPGMEIRVVDDAGVALGERRVGRIEIAGPNVTAGYEPLAGERAPAPRRGGLATGDLGFLHDGCVFVTGREKDVVFVNGRKLHSHDLEEILVRHAGLRLGRVAVVGYRDWRAGVERVAILFASSKKVERLEAEIVAIAGVASRELPFPIDHVLPIGSIPRTTSGKIERYRLRDRLASGDLDALAETTARIVREARTTDTATSPLETAILRACDATGGQASGLGADASFVRLVGDSLRVIELAARLAASDAHPALARVTPALLHRERTPRAVARYLESGAIEVSEPIVRTERTRAPLSHAQTQLWLAHAIDPASTAYSEAHFCDLPRGVDLGTLARAVRAVFAARAALRTAFVEIDGEVLQEVRDEGVDVPLVRVPGADLRDAARADARADAARPHVLGASIPVRAALYHGDDGQAALYLNVHHILLDGASMTLVLRAIASAYADAVTALPREGVPSLDAYEVERRALSGAPREAALAYWREVLAPWPARVAFPAADAPTDARATVLAIDASLAEALRSAASRSGFTPYQIALAAFALLLSHASEAGDVTVGTMVSGRARAELVDVVAYLANTVAVRIDVGRAPTFRSLVEAVAARTDEILRHQEVPLSALRRDLAPPGPSAWPPYAAVFTMMAAPEDDDETRRLFAHHEPVRVHAKADLLLAVETTHGAMRCIWETSARHDEAQVAEWHARWTAIVARMAEDLDAPLVYSRILGEADRAQVAALDPPAAPPPAHLTINGYVAASVVARADAIAVSDRERAVTYRELDARVDALARKLRSLGAARNTFVPIVVPKGVDMIVACLAVLRSGAAYVPIDADHPEARIEELVVRSHARIVVAHPDFAAMLRARLGDEAPRFVAPDDLVLAPDAIPLPLVNEPDDAAYMHFTSGSTGAPKGVVDSHRAVCHLVDWYLADRIYLAEDVIPQLPGFAFEASAGEIFPALAAGARLHVFPPVRSLLPEQLLAELVRVRAHVITITPSYLQRMVQSLTPEARRAWPIRRVMLAGEALLVTQAREFRARFGPEVVIANAYGPTEATLHATIDELPVRIEDSSGSIPIGRPFRHRRAHVVDALGRLCEPGQVGEIWLGGEGLAREYLGDRARTDEAFVALHLGARTERVYRTGDYAVVQPDGRLRFCGRRDGQVKVRGYRVELGEVEDALRRLDGIDEAVVVPRKAGDGDARLVAFFTSASDPRPADLVAALGRALPAYMVPSQLVKVDAMPKSTNEKIDRKALAARLEESAVETASAPVAEDDPIRRDVLAVMKEVLRAPAVAAEDNFFALGGDSIASMDVVARLAKLGYRLEPLDVLKTDTVGELAARLASRVPPRAPAVPPSGPAALTPAQTRFFASGSAMGAHLTIAIDTAAAVDPERLRVAVVALAARHEILRATLRRTAVGVQQVIREALADLVVLVAVPAADVASRVSPKSPIAVAVIPRAGGGSRVLLALHALIADVPSAATLAGDLVRLYAGEAIPEAAPPYRALAQRLADLSDWDGDASALASELPRWSAALASPPDVDLGRAAGVRTRHVGLERAATDALFAASEAARIEPRDVIVAALARAVADVASVGAVPVELTGDAREALGDGARGAIGAFDAQYPIAIDAAGDVLDVATRIKQTRGALALGGAGFELVRFASGAAPGDADTSSYLPPAIRCAVRDARSRSLGHGWTHVASPPFGTDDGARDGLAVVAVTVDDGLSITLTARGAVDDARLDRVAAALSLALAAVPAAHARRERPCFAASDFPLAALSDAELATLPADTVDVYPLTPMQEAMLFSSITSDDSPVYHEQVVYEHDGDLDAPRLERAYAELVERHEILRTVVRTEGLRRPAQIVLRAQRTDVEAHDWSARDEAGQRAALASYLEIDRAERRFDLARGPLLRIAVARTSAERTWLVLSFHHIILDGWSQSALVAELVRRYRALGEGTALETAPMGGRFADFVGRVLPLAKSPEAAAFWKERMAAPTYNELPLDDARAADGPRPAASHADVFFGADLSARLGRFAAQQRVSLNAVCLAGYLYLLHTLTGDADVATGVITSGRLPDVPDSDRILGCFLNTFPARLRFDEETVTFEELVRAANEHLMEARPHEHFPLKEIAKLVSGGAAGGGRAELFSTLYAFQSYKDDAGDQAGLRVVGGHDTTNYDLAVLLFNEGELRIVAEYAGDVLRERTVMRWLGQLVHLLDVLSSSPGTAIHRLDLLSDEQRAQYAAYNRTGVDFETDVTMNELFERTAAAAPDRVAVSASGVQVHYGALNDDANRIARALVAWGAGSGQFVACALHRRAPAVAALMGVLKSGAAYVPIDPRYPTERIALLAGDCDARILVTDVAAIREGNVRLDALPGVAHVLVVDAIGDADLAAPPGVSVLGPAEWSGLDAGDLERRASPDDVAYVIYTSGSTGRPKGVVIRHFSAVNTIFGINRLYEVGPADRVLCFSSFCFDLSVWDLFGTLAAGAEVVLASEAQIKSGDALLDLIDERAVTIWDSVPTGMSQVVQTRKLHPSSHALTSVRLVMLSGEFIPLGLPAEIRRTFPNTSVSSLGGATEGTVWSIYYYPVTDVRPSWRSIPYGWPLPNQGYYVLNSAMKPCLVDQPGMLYIVGKGVAKEYFKDPERTAAAFVQDPFDDDPKAIIYRTGDLGRMKADGWIEIIGRKDAQVKIRGYRIELGEVENQLGLHPLVKEAVVLVSQDGQGHKRMDAYFASDDGALDGEKLAAFLRTKLPDYMVPSRFHRVEKMPVNSSGKIDRKRLPELTQGARLALATAYAPPETPIEEAIAEVWKGILGVERVGRDDNYFALGGDSILSLQVASRLAERGYTVKPSELFKHPTVARLAASIGEGKDGRGAAAIHAPVVGIAPLTPAQKWFFGLGLVDETWWHLSLEIEIDEAIEPARLEAALAAIAERHDLLRARFDRVGAAVTQSVAPPGVGVPLTVVDATGADADEQSAVIAEQALTARRRIDLARGPLTLATLIRFAPDRHRLVWVVHHAVVDVVSWRVLAQDLATAYASPGALPPRSTSTAEWSARVEAVFDAGDAVNRLAPWADVLGGGRFTLATRRDDDTESTAAHLDVRVDADVTRALVEQASGCFNTTTHDLVLAACVIASARIGAGEAVTIDVEHHGRTLFEDATDLSRTVGWFTAIHPLRVAVDRATSTADAIVAVKEKLRALRGHGDGFLALRGSRDPQVQRALEGYRDQDLLLNFVGNLDAGALADSWRVVESAAPDHGPANRRTHPLDLMVALKGGQLVARLAYSETSISLERAQAFAAAFAGAVADIVRCCTDDANRRRTASDFPLLRLDAADLARLQGDAIEDAYPLSAMQRGMLFFSELYPASPLYHVHCVAVLRADLDVALLERALNLVAEATPILRTRFARTSHEPVQIVEKRATYRIDFEDVSAQAPEVHEARRRAFLAECTEGDVVGRFPNMQIKVFQRAPDVFELVQFFHHALLDGWSNAALLGSILETYARLRDEGDGGAVRVPVLASSFRDFIAHERAEEASAASEVFWRERLRDMTVNELPLDRPRTGARKFATELLHFRLDSELAGRVRAVARAEGSTLSEVLVAAHVALVSLLTGDDDVTIGYSLAARPGHIPHIDRLVGNFLNTVPLRVAVDASIPLRDVVAEVRRALRETREHEAYPLTSIVRAAGVTGGPGGSPFRTMFTAENYPGARFPAGVQGIDGYNWHMTEYDLAVVLTEMKVRDDANQFKDEVFLKLAFANDVLGKETVTAWFGLLEAILGAIGEPAAPGDPGASLGDILAARIAPVAGGDLRDAPLFGEQLARAFRQWPARRAIVSDGEAMTYAELQASVERFEGAFAAVGIGSDDRVLVAVRRRSVFGAAAIAAGLALGVPIVPVDGALPPCRLRALALAVNAVAVVTDDGRRVAEALGADAAGLRAIFTPRLIEPREGSHAPDAVRFVDVSQASRIRVRRPVAASTVAYVIHSSGTTGAPKGVAITQAALASFLAWYGGEAAITDTDRVSQCLPAGFDASLSEIVPTLAAGGEVRIDADLASTAPLDVVARTAAQGVTVLTLPAPYFEAIAHALPGAPLVPLASLRLVVVGGDRLSRSAVRAWQQRHPRVPVMNVYGLTEATIASSAHRIDAPIAADSAPGSIAIGRQGRGLVLLDSRLALCKPGDVGEIWITGPTVTVTPLRGRVFTARDGTRILRTRDAGRLHDDGTIEHVGRLDAEVKVRGQRIDRRLVERTLESLDGVTHAIVQVESNGDAGRRALVAYVESQNLAGADPHALRDALSARLPAAMVPSFVIPVARIPRDASGKASRDELSRIFAREAAPARADDADEISVTLAALWRRVLGAPHVSPDASFFEAGGDSLAAMRLIADVRRELHAHVPLEAVLAAGSLGDLAARVRRARDEAAGGEPGSGR